MKKFICLFLSISTIAYSLAYAALGGFIGNNGALSKIGLKHPVLFAIWGILTYLTLTYHIILGFKATKYKFHFLMLAIAFIGMTLTLACDFDYKLKTQYMLHCIGSLSFSSVMGATVFFMFFLKKDRLFAAISGTILLIDLILLLIFKETALIELAPIFAGCIMMTVHNLKKEKIAVEIK